MRTLVAAAAAAVLTGCLVPPVSPAQRLSESAHDMSSAMRFGRLDVALEHVASAARDEFARRHERWGRDLWIVDLELTEVRSEGADEASVHFSVSWQRLDEAHLRVTRLKQRWRDDRGGWRMTAEEQSGGDAGLLGDSAKGSVQAGQASRRSVAGYQTRVIRAAE
jgi:hypothetical protein